LVINAYVEMGKRTPDNLKPEDGNFTVLVRLGV